MTLYTADNGEEITLDRVFSSLDDEATAAEIDSGNLFSYLIDLFWSMEVVKMTKKQVREIIHSKGTAKEKE